MQITGNVIKPTIKEELIAYLNKTIKNGNYEIMPRKERKHSFRKTKNFQEYTMKERFSRNPKL